MGTIWDENKRRTHGTSYEMGGFWGGPRGGGRVFLPSRQHLRVAGPLYTFEKLRSQLQQTVYNGFLFSTTLKTSIHVINASIVLLAHAHCINNMRIYVCMYSHRYIIRPNNNTLYRVYYIHIYTPRPRSTKHVVRPIAYATIIITTKTTTFWIDGKKKYNIILVT